MAAQNSMGGQSNSNPPNNNYQGSQLQIINTINNNLVGLDKFNNPFSLMNGSNHPSGSGLGLGVGQPFNAFGQQALNHPGAASSSLF